MQRTLLFVLTLIAISGFALTAFAEPQDEKPVANDKKPKFTIGKETTYVTGPLDKSGYIDYETALNDRLAAGVTPDNNAFVLLTKALGPRPEGFPLSQEYYKRLGIPALSEDGEYLVEWLKYAKEQLKLDVVAGREDLERELEEATQRPWTTKQHPNLAGWLKVNEKPLALVIEAGQRPAFYAPLLSKKTEMGNTGLMAALLPATQKCRALAKALNARALLHAGEKRCDEAWNDLLACHRLARVVARGGTLIEALVGMAIDIHTAKADLAFLDNPELDAKRISACLRDLQALPRPPLVADKIDLSERIVALEMFMLLDRYGVKYLEVLSGGGAGSPGKTALKDWLSDLMLKNIDWDSALRNTNRWYDRLAAAARGKDRATREKDFEQIDRDLKALRTRLGEPGGMGAMLKEYGWDRGRLFSDLVTVLLLPATAKVQTAADRGEQTHHNLCIAFALAVYQREHGKYPEKLEALTPAYLPEAPQDLFVAGPLIYRPSAKGYLLYSVGPNKKDEQGRASDDNPPGDDLRVQMPLPPRERP
jgi:hypothetical protein